MSRRFDVSERTEPPVLISGEIQTYDLEFTGFANRHLSSSNIVSGTSVAYAFSKVNNATSIGNVSTSSTVADIVRAARKAKKLTQIELAEKVGMSQRWVSDVERGATHMPRLDTLQRLAEVLELDMADLMIAGRWASTIESANELARIAEQHHELVSTTAGRATVTGNLVIATATDADAPLTDAELDALRDVVFTGLNDLTPRQLRDILKIVHGQ